MKNLFIALFTLIVVALQAQTGHVLQGAGAVNFSMGGAATAMPADVLGTLQWNPAAITAFDRSAAALSVAYFTAAPEVFAAASNQQLNPLFISAENPLGKIPHSEIKSSMYTDVVLVGISYAFGK